MFVDQHSFDYFSWKLMPPKSIWINVISTIMLLLINHKLRLKQMLERWNWHFRVSRFQNFLRPLDYHSRLLFQSQPPTSKHFETPDQSVWEILAWGHYVQSVRAELRSRFSHGDWLSSVSNLLILSNQENDIHLM